MKRLTKRGTRKNGYVSAIGSGLGCWEQIIDRLAAYEDTGLMPEEITTGQSWCVFYCNRKCNLDGDFCAEGPGCPRELAPDAAMRLLEIATPNTPLTLGELKQMAGDAVWVVTDRLQEWCIVHSYHSADVGGGGIIMTRRTAEKRTYPYADYGKTWLAYRRKLEEGVTQSNA